MIFAKLANNDVGLYFKDGQFIALGVIKTSAAYEEVLGYWFIPAMLMAVLVFYTAITFLLRLKRSLNKNK